jgi:hypothetical protein
VVFSKKDFKFFKISKKNFKFYLKFMLFFSLLRRDEHGGQDRRNQKKFSLENFSHYREAFVAGQQGAPNSTTSNCIAMFPNCSFEGSAARAIDFQMLQYWQKLSDFVPLTIHV